jgi:hypothetical protein
VIRRLPRRLTWLLACAAGLALVAAVAVGVALLVTPMQTVTVAGQVIKVGTTSPRLSLSGPGEVDLFGQNLPTVVRFTGPVRPRLALTQITIDSELANFAQGSSPGSATHLLGARLNDGWTRYFAWEAGLAGLTALILTGAVAGWRRLPAGPTARPLLPGVQAVVIGDSTAAGAGLSLVADASHIDRACGRSSDSYAEDLAGANGWRVMNLACNAATISHGLLGPEHRHGLLVPAQLGATVRAQDASVVIVSVGADDLKWSAIVEFCAAAPRCNDRASTAYFQQKLAAFSKDYFQLLTELANLHGRPRVIINLYYDPFGNDLKCIAGRGLTAAKVAILRSRLVTLNKVLSTGAAEFGYASVQPSFAGHQLCAPQPYVQGAGDLAPFHPTELGQLAIALADQVALTGASGTTGGGATGTPGTPGATGSPAP